jgi:hypothetical protein
MLVITTQETIAVGPSGEVVGPFHWPVPRLTVRQSQGNTSHLHMVRRVALQQYRSEWPLVTTSWLGRARWAAAALPAASLSVFRADDPLTLFRDGDLAGQLRVASELAC